jgi:hypothetical protein
VAEEEARWRLGVDPERKQGMGEDGRLGIGVRRRLFVG